MASQRKSPMDHPVVVTFLILAVIGAMSLAAEMLKPLALAVLLSFALAPLAGFFERRRVPRAIAVLFMLMNREDVGDRIVQLFGQRQINLTTRTMGEIGQRISRYLAMITLVNAGYGLIVGLGLWAIGVPYAVLWGCLAAMMRFIPYVGAAVAFLLPLVFAVAHFPGWSQPLEVIALFGAVEVALNYLEPVIYGKTTGVSALGLLVAAMFWTWLWGLLGTLLSTPMTLCL